MHLKHTSYQIIIYSIGNILLKIVGLLLIPIYTSLFNTAEFGIITIIETTTLLITTILSLNLSTGLIRWLSDKKDIIYEKSIIFTILLISIVLIILFTCLTFPFYKQISLLLFKTDLYRNLILLMFINVYIDIINRIPLNLIRVREKPVLYSVSMIIKAIVTLGTTIILLKHTSLGIAAVIIGGIAGNGLFFLSTAPLLFKNIIFKLALPEIKPLLKFCYPLIFVGLCGILLSMGDRYVLSFLKDYADVGIYGLGYKVASVANIFVLQAFNLAILPIALKSFDSIEGKQLISKIFTYSAVVLCFIFLVISFFSFDVLKIFIRNDEFLAANKIVPILLFAYIFDGLRIMYSYHLLYLKKTNAIAYITLSVACLNILLNFIFIPKYSYIGAAFTTLITSIVSFFIFQRIAQKAHYTKYEYKKVVFIIVLSIAFFLLHKLVPQNFYLHFLWLIFFIFILFSTKCVSRKDFK